MKDPRRLLDFGADELELALLRAGDADRPRDAARRAAMVAAGLSGAAIASLPKTASGSAGVISATRVAAWKWWLLGAVSSVSLAGAGYWTTARREPAVRAVAAPASAPSREQPPRADSSTNAPPPPAPDAESALVPERTVPTPAAPRAAPALSAAGIETQIALIDRARSAAASGQPRTTLAVLDEYQKRYPNGVLLQEATLLRVESLLALGDRSSATRLGKAFLAQHPRSALAPRIRSLVTE